MALEAKKSASWRPPVLHHHQSSSGLATFVGGANAFKSAAQCPRWTPPAPRWGPTTFKLDDLTQALTPAFTTARPARSDPRAATSSDSFSGGAGPTGGIAGLEVAFQEDSRPQFPVGIDKALLTQTATRRSASPPPLAPALARKTCSPFGPASLSSLTDRFVTVPHPQRGTGGHKQKPRAGAGLWLAVPNGFSVSANYVAAKRQASAIPVRWHRHQRLRRHRTVQIGYGAEQWASPSIYSTLQGRRRCAWRPRLSTCQQPWWRTPPVAPNAVGPQWFWQPGQLGWIHSISAGWDNTTPYDSDQE